MVKSLPIDQFDLFGNQLKYIHFWHYKHLRFKILAL